MEHCHDGHRQRLLNTILRAGLKNLSDVQILEYILSLIIPRKDTNPLAHVLLKEFGSLVNVLDASTEELEKIEGVGENISTFLTLIKQVERFYKTEQKKAEKILRTIDQCADYLIAQFHSRDQETVLCCVWMLSAN